MDIAEIRRTNMHTFLTSMDRATLAGKLGYDDVNYLNQILAGNTNLGSNAARKFERKLEKSTGWLDVPQYALWPDSDDKSIPDRRELKRKIDQLTEGQAASINTFVDQLLDSMSKNG